VFGMTDHRFAEFIQNHMRMAHVYQPVMLFALPPLFA
jgi:hypothetical protein